MYGSLEARERRVCTPLSHRQQEVVLRYCALCRWVFSDCGENQRMLPMRRPPLWASNVRFEILMGILHLSRFLDPPSWPALKESASSDDGSKDPGRYESHLLLAILGISLAMLGPGHVPSCRSSSEENASPSNPLTPRRPS